MFLPPCSGTFLSFPTRCEPTFTATRECLCDNCDWWTLITLQGRNRLLLKATRAGTNFHLTNPSQMCLQKDIKSVGLESYVMATPTWASGWMWKVHAPMQVILAPPPCWAAADHACLPNPPFPPGVPVQGGAWTCSRNTEHTGAQLASPSLCAVSLTNHSNSMTSFIVTLSWQDQDSKQGDSFSLQLCRQNRVQQVLSLNVHFPLMSKSV